METDWQPSLTGKRLELRPLRADDLEPLFAVAADPLIWEQHPDKTRCTREGFEKFFKAGLESKGALAVVDRATGELIGSSRFADHRSQAGSVEIGYTFLARKHWGTGTNAELKRLMLAYAFEHVKTVYFVISPENFRSRKAVERLGASQVPEDEAKALVYDKRCSVVYRLTKP
ncbi:MAG: acetyltransferase [Elusimicrobia bacterium]|nr:MAG: acetyltransferase [Elusimicrobiota bacterium]